MTSGLNMTYFWSNTANHWLNTLDQFDPLLKDDDDYIQNLKWNFKSSVTFDGYRKLKNFSPSNNGCCICIVSVQMKWPLICLMISLVASLIFAAAGMTFASNRGNN